MDKITSLGVFKKMDIQVHLSMMENVNRKLTATFDLKCLATFL